MKFIAKENKRVTWDIEYTDDDLKKLIKRWIFKKLNDKNANEKEKQKKMYINVKEKLSMFMLKQNENFIIHNEFIITDYFALCKVYKDFLMLKNNDAEFNHKETLYQ
jgi:hypothetical protein